MGEMDEGKLLLSLALPIMLSMLVQALYNIVDSIYVARVSEDCLSALSLAFPAQNIMIGLGTGTGVGVSTLISRALGRRDAKAASRAAGNAVFLAVCCWALMALFGLFGADAFIHSQTDIAEIRGHADSYLRIVTIGSLFMYMQMTMEKLLQSTGLTRLSMWTQMFGAVTNIILDPFFIFGWCGLPAMGTAGAAIATVLGQAAGMTLGIILHRRRNHEIRIVRGDLRPDWKIIKAVYRIGFPSVVMMVVGSATNYMMNRILKERIYRTFRYGVLYASFFMVLGFLLFQFMPGALLGIFSPSENMLAIGVPALRRISISFLFAGFCIVAGSVCQALDKSAASLAVSVLRQLVALVPAAWLLARTGDVNMVWWSFPIAEIISLAASAFFLRAAFRHMERVLGERQDI